MNKNYLSGMGIIVLALMLVFTSPVAATNVAYLDPDPSCATPGETTYVEMRLNSTEGVTSMEMNIYFDPDVLNITDMQPGDFPNQFCWCNWGNYIALGGVTSDWMNLPPGDYLFVNMTVEANNSGTCVLGDYKRHHLWDEYFDEIFDVVWLDGTFECTGLPTTFTKSLTPGWNLISPPLTPSDNNVSEVLDGVSYTVVYRYDATSKEFECPDTMDPGIGYFVDVTAASTWEYEGTPVSSTSPGLKSGLNMIGVPNCTMSVSDAMGPAADYRYVARWNVVDKKFEVYNPSAPVAFHHFDSIEAGEGYFISAGSDDAEFAISCLS